MGCAGLLLLMSLLRSGRAGRADQIGSPADRVILGEAQEGLLYAVTISLKDPARIQGKEAFHVSVSDAQGLITDKRLHSADLDFCFTYLARANGAVVAAFDGSAGTAVPSLSTSLR